MKKIIICIGIAVMIMVSAAYSIELSEDLKLVGWIGTYYLRSDDQSVNDGFDFKYARMLFFGKAGEDFSYLLDIDAAASTDILRNASITYRSLPFNITAGQFVAPFSYAVLAAPPDWHTIELPVNSSMVPTFVRGVMIDSSLNENKFYYAAALVNGTGTNTDDDNKAKDVVGRIVFKPLDALSMGVSYQTGEQGLSATGSYEGHRIRQGVMFVYEPDRFSLLGEYVSQNSGRTGTLSDVLSYTWHLTGAYMLFPGIQGVLQYSQSEPDQGTAGDVETVTTVGCNLIFNEKCKLQVNYRQLGEESGSQTDNNQFLMQIITWL
jgi:hypothetical protein